MSRRVLADFDSEIQLRTGNRSDVTTTIRGFALQDAARALANLVEDPALERTALLTLTQASDELDPTAAPNTATDVWWPLMLRNTTDGSLIGPGSKSQIEAATKTSGVPNRYYWFNGKLVFDALANTAKTIKLWYKRSPVDFTINPETDQLYDPLIITKAAELCFISVRDFDEALKQRGVLTAQMRELNLPTQAAQLDHVHAGIRVRV